MGGEGWSLENKAPCEGLYCDLDTPRDTHNYLTPFRLALRNVFRSPTPTLGEQCLCVYVGVQTDLSFLTSRHSILALLHFTNHSNGEMVKRWRAEGVVFAEPLSSPSAKMAPARSAVSLHPLCMVCWRQSSSPATALDFQWQEGSGGCLPALPAPGEGDGGRGPSSSQAQREAPPAEAMFECTKPSEDSHPHLSCLNLELLSASLWGAGVSSALHAPRQKAVLLPTSGCQAAQGSSPSPSPSGLPA